MKKITRVMVMCMIFSVLVTFPVKLYAADDVSQFQTEEQEVIQGEIIDKIGIDNIDEYLGDRENLSDISFLELVEKVAQGEWDISYEKIKEILRQKFLGELEENRELMVQMLMLGIVFAILKNFTEIFENEYISKLCFLLVYCILLVLIMKSFLLMDHLTKDTIYEVVEFMQTLIPVFCMSMVFSTGTLTAAGFYELAFIVIYLIQWIILYILVPFVQVFVIFEFMNYLLEGEKFSRMTELLEGVITLSLKVLTTVVIGLNIVQGLIQPAADHLKTTTFSKAASAIPGVGNSINAVSSILVGTGTLVKNSVGVSAMIILFLLCLEPILKLAVMAFLYKLTAALVEPMADKRISGSVNGVCKGSILLTRILLTSTLLFLITIAMITASTSFIA